MSTRQHILGPTVLGLALVLASSLGVVSAAPIDNDDERHEIHVERKVICDGDDCSEGSGDHKMIFIGPDGESRAIDGDFKWIHGEGGSMTMKLHAPGLKGGFLGVRLTELTPELREHFGVPDDVGVMVSKVVDDSPAQRAGIQVGDIITLVDSEEVASAGALSHAIGGHEEGDTVTLEIWRDGAVQRLSATLEEREGMRMALMPKIHLDFGDGERAERRIHIRCDSDDEECAAGVGDFDCGGAEECRVEVECSDGDCTCTVNGEDADCAAFPGVPHP